MSSTDKKSYPKKQMLYRGDGIPVGEVLITGDVEIDEKTVREFALANGSVEGPTLVQAMFKQALSFEKAASLIHRVGLIGPTANAFSLPPFVVNCAFSIELYLKTLAQGQGRSLKGHDLVKLFDNLPTAAASIISDVVAKRAPVELLGETPDFRKTLIQIKDAFIQWRYCYELQQTALIEIRPTIFVVECMHEACKRLPDLLNLS